MTHVAHSAAANAAVVATHSTAAKVKPASATTATHGLATTATTAAAAGLNSGLRPLFRQGKLLDIAGTVGSFGFQHIVHPRLHRLCKFTIR